ncbi:DsbA family protein [Sphingomicrobium sp. XHP0235]|uniref:DsbA family protein n=1 Tax=Sphingomicrobium aquimarinum TaxID=3133971 RepID=UPI0031FE87D4
MADKTVLAALGGGVLGAGLTAAILVAAGPQLMGERMVRTAMTDHPEILVDAGEALRRQQLEPVLEQNRGAIETAFFSSAKGASAEEADVVMVEFYDYACGFCRQTKPEVERLLAEDPKLRVVYRELPVLGPDSMVAARASLAASKAGKFDAFHQAMWAAGRPSEASIDEALAAVGIERSALQDPAFDAELQKNFDIANALGASGTPLFVIGDTIIPGAESYESYKAAVAKAREG